MTICSIKGVVSSSASSPSSLIVDVYLRRTQAAYARAHDMYMCMYMSMYIHMPHAHAYSCPCPSPCPRPRPMSMPMSTSTSASNPALRSPSSASASLSSSVSTPPPPSLGPLLGRPCPGAGSLPRPRPEVSSCCSWLCPSPSAPALVSLAVSSLGLSSRAGVTAVTAVTVVAVASPSGAPISLGRSLARPLAFKLARWLPSLPARSLPQPLACSFALSLRPLLARSLICLLANSIAPSLARSLWEPRERDDAA